MSPLERSSTGRCLIAWTAFFSLTLLGSQLGAQAPRGWIQDGAWLMLAPLGNDLGCDPGAAAGESWVAPFDLARAAPAAGEEWAIDFGQAASTRWGGAGETPVWLRLADAGFQDGDTIDLLAIVDSLAAAAGGPPALRENAVAVLATYVEYAGESPLRVWLCSSSDDSIRVLVNDEVVQQTPVCAGVTTNCRERAPALLLPGVNAIKVILWQGTGGWGFRLRLQRPGGNTITEDDPEFVFSPDLTDPVAPSGGPVTRSLAPASPGAGCARLGGVDVTLTGSGAGAESVTLREDVTGPFEVSGVTGDGIFTPAVPPDPRPVGIFEDSRDLGEPCFEGQTIDEGDGSYTILGGGIDLWTAGDECHFAYRRVTGDFRMTARVAERSFVPGSRWGKVGIMAREDLSRASRYAMIQTHGEDPQDADRFAGRFTRFGADNFEQTPLVDFEHRDWQRLSRSGNVFTAELSADGVEWELIGERDYGATMPRTLLLGLAVGGHSEPEGGCEPASIRFDSIEIAGGDDPEVAAPSGGTITWRLSRDELAAGVGYHVRGEGSALLAGDDGGRATLGPGRVRSTAADVPLGLFDVAADIGSPCTPGASAYDEASGAYSITGSGVDIWTNGDQFQYAYRAIGGDFTLTARVRERGWSPGSRWGKAGLMVREDCTDRARHAMVQINGEDPVDGDRFAGRPTPGGADNFEDPLPAFEHRDWLRLTRVGNLFSGAFSRDGADWVPIHTMDWGPSAPSRVLLGLAVCAHTEPDGCPPATIVFDRVELTFPAFSVSRELAGGPCAPDDRSRAVRLVGEGDPGSSIALEEVVRTGLTVSGVTGGGVVEPIAEPGPPQPVGIFSDARDVGAPCGEGFTVENPDGSYTLRGGGRDIWTEGDEFHFAYRRVSGDFELLVHIAARAWVPGGRWGKAGVMLRENLDPQARYAMVQDLGEDPRDAIRFAGRGTHGGRNNYESMPLAEFEHRDWLRLARAGDVVTGYVSDDGAGWEPLGSVDWGEEAPRTLLAGLAVCAHTADGCQSAEITFDSVEVTGGEGPEEPLVPLGAVITWDAPRAALEAEGVGYTLEGRGVAISQGVADEQVVTGPGLLEVEARREGDLGLFTTARDIGAPCRAGATAHDPAEETYTLRGAGVDIWTAGDEFHYAYRRVSGDFSLTAHVRERDWAPGSRWGKVGIMAREECGRSARYAMAQTHGEDLQDGDRLAGRPTPGGDDNFERPPLDPFDQHEWLRLDREGTLFTGYASHDGDSWESLGSMDWGETAPEEVLLGLAVCAHSHTSGGCAPATIVFDQVELRSGPPPRGPLFHRGDPTGDGNVNITDGIFVLNWLFLGGPAPGCLEAADTNDDGGVNITDGIAILNFLFLGGPAPAPPGPPSEPCGPDPDGDLGCALYPPCGP